MSKVLQALPPPEQSQASQALPTACPPTLRCRRLPPTVVALYNWAGLCPVRRSWPLWTGERDIRSGWMFSEVKEPGAKKKAGTRYAPAR
jgi:hypothetical protein